MIARFKGLGTHRDEVIVYTFITVCNIILLKKTLQKFIKILISKVLSRCIVSFKIDNY